MPYSSASAVVLQAANPQEASCLESLYPFDEYGAGLWGDAASFAAVRDKVLRERRFMRTNRDGHVALAFVMPECHSLGFSFRPNGEVQMDGYHKAAEFFRRRVWRV